MAMTATNMMDIIVIQNEGETKFKEDRNDSSVGGVVIMRRIVG